MAQIIIKRTDFTPAATFGRLIIDGVDLCDTLEPTDRAIEWDGSKVYGQTAIPLGQYTYRLWDSPKFRTTTLRLQSVPHFTDILVHAGNYPTHTRGCILVGTRTADMLINSTRTLADIIERVKTSHTPNTITVTR